MVPGAWEGICTWFGAALTCFGRGYRMGNT